MYQDKYILCVIPARGGSKRLPGKNIKPFLGVPLIGYAIRAAKGSKYIDRVIVTTDDESIASVAKEEGAEVPFMRPGELATDTATSLAPLQHAVQEVEKEGKKVDTIVLIQPTVPGVLTEDVDATVEKLFSSSSNSAITVCPISDPPEWMFRVDEEGRLNKYIDGPANNDLEKLYKVNGAVYAMPRKTVIDNNQIIDVESCAAVIMPRERSVDIDTQTDFDMAEMLLTKSK
jgi:CMP-N,N'-diacetyllegionaminic acid synthase